MKTKVKPKAQTAIRKVIVTPVVNPNDKTEFFVTTVWFTNDHVYQKGNNSQQWIPLPGFPVPA